MRYDTDASRARPDAVSMGGINPAHVQFRDSTAYIDEIQMVGRAHRRLPVSRAAGLITRQR
jgi:hypothetical protein